jgi:hypothetical protein
MKRLICGFVLTAALLFRPNPLWAHCDHHDGHHGQHCDHCKHPANCECTACKAARQSKNQKIAPQPGQQGNTAKPSSGN